MHNQGFQVDVMDGSDVSVCETRRSTNQPSKYYSSWDVERLCDGILTKFNRVVLDGLKLEFRFVFTPHLHREGC
jgi:hypothetical protein